MAYKKVDQDDISYLASVTSKDRVFFGEDIIDDYSHDEMPIYGKYLPEAVVEVLDADEVKAVVRYASDKKIPITPRGAGTGLCGGSVALFGGILLSTARMNRIIEIDEENLVVVTEPGILLSDLKNGLSEKGMLYPPDPGEKGASVGGNVMTNAGGMRAVKYGVTRDYVRGMDIVLPDGEEITLGGKIVKNSSGYSLLNIFVGSEGTLGIVTRLILKIIPAPGHTVSLLVPFGNITDCISAVPDILKSRPIPTAIEFMQKGVIEAAEGFVGKKFPHDTSEAYLLLMFDGDSPEVLEDTYMKAAEICLEKGAEDVLVADSESKLEAVWGIRDVFLEAIKNSTTLMDECDVVVPVSGLASFVEEIGILAFKYGLRILSFGHAGDGNVHVYICKDQLDDLIWEERLCGAMKDLYAKAAELKGQVSGEHGIGHAKTCYLDESAGSSCMRLMRALKDSFDPDDIMNPGKIVRHYNNA